MGSDKQESRESQYQVDEWEKIRQEENDLSLAERKTNQLKKLQQIIDSLHSNFGINLIATVKQIRGETLSPEESIHLQSNPDKDELLDRIKGLLKVFENSFYKALETATGTTFDIDKGQPADVPQDETEVEVAKPETSSESARTSKLPKGFNKWDLKLVKLHESQPGSGKRVWVEFWTLKGMTGVGEILYNPTKDLFYFKPYDASIQSFAMTDEHGRKATAQARNYYFRVSPNPPVAE